MTLVSFPMGIPGSSELIRRTNVDPIDTDLLTGGWIPFRTNPM